LDERKRRKKSLQLPDAQITMQVPTDKTERKKRRRTRE